MPKALTYLGLVTGALVGALFVFDLALKFPFKRASLAMDICFVISAALLAIMSWMTLREQS